MMKHTGIKWPLLEEKIYKRIQHLLRWKAMANLILI